jgi:glycosyltransferase involved in cell wall biosynthesis
MGGLNIMQEEEHIMKDKNLLVVYLHFPKDPPMSFPALILKYLVRLGWSVTVAVLEFGEKPKEVMEEWSGVKLLRITAPLNWFSSLSLRLNSRRNQDIEGLRLAAAKKGRQRVIGSPYRGLTLLRSTVANLLNAFGKYDHFSPYVRSALMKIHEKKPFSVVMSVFYGSFASHVVARQFARESHLPWVALVKDYWRFVPFATSVVSPISLKNAFRKQVEAKVLRDADILLPHCQPVANYLSAIVPRAQMRMLPNCYDEEDFIETPKFKVQSRNGVFTALCLGAQAPTQRFDIFFNALRDLRASGSVDAGSFHVKFVGGQPNLMHSYAETYSCSDLVEAIPQVSHEEAMLLLKQATCLLFPNAPDVLGRRTPEYIAARKPILVFPEYGTSASQKILEKSGAAFVARDSREIAITLIEWYRAFKAGNNICAPINEQFVRSFSARNRALELEEILIDVLRDNTELPCH